MEWEDCGNTGHKSSRLPSTRGNNSLTKYIEVKYISAGIRIMLMKAMFRYFLLYFLTSYVVCAFHNVLIRNQTTATCSSMLLYNCELQCAVVYQQQLSCNKSRNTERVVYNDNILLLQATKTDILEIRKLQNGSMLADYAGKLDVRLTSKSVGLVLSRIGPNIILNDNNILAVPIQATDGDWNILLFQYSDFSQMFVLIMVHSLSLNATLTSTPFLSLDRYKLRVFVTAKPFEDNISRVYISDLRCTPTMANCTNRAILRSAFPDVDEIMMSKEDGIVFLSNGSVWWRQFDSFLMPIRQPVPLEPLNLIYESAIVTNDVSDITISISDTYMYLIYGRYKNVVQFDLHRNHWEAFPLDETSLAISIDQSRDLVFVFDGKKLHKYYNVEKWLTSLARAARRRTEVSLPMESALCFSYPQHVQTINSEAFFYRHKCVQSQYISQAPSAAPTISPIYCSFSAAETNTATNINTDYNCSFNACNGFTVSVSLCPSAGATCQGDTFIRLLQYAGEAANEVTYNDDSCDLCSSLTYTIPNSGCSTFMLALGCYSMSSCSGTVVVNFYANSAAVSSPSTLPSTPQPYNRGN